MAQGYKALSDEQKTRVNGLILASLRDKPENTGLFREGFPFAHRAQAFDETLSMWRDMLAQKIGALPPLDMPEGATHTLGAQSKVFHNLRDIIGQEKPGAVYTDTQIMQMVRKMTRTMLDQGTRPVKFPLPQEGEYPDLAMILGEQRTNANFAAAIAKIAADPEQMGILGALACSENPENAVTGQCVPLVQQAEGNAVNGRDGPR